MSDEKNVSRLLIIKRERDEFGDLIKAISDRCSAAHKELEAFAKADRTLNLKDLGLPVAEVQARESISKAQAKELLKNRDKELELKLLLTQDKALQYGAHLAEVTARAEPDTQRAQFFQQLSRDLTVLHEKVYAMLVGNYRWQGQ